MRRAVLSVCLAVLSFLAGADCLSGVNPSSHPSRRGYASILYDRETGMAYLLGGSKKIGSYYTLYDVWRFNTVTRSWEKLFEDKAGSFFNAFQAEAMALDSRSKKILIYSNFIVPDVGVETWIYDIRRNTFENVTSGTEPPSRWGSRMVYDSESRRAILFGGSDNYTAETRNETWTYDFTTNTWSNMEPALSPPPHHYGAMTYLPFEDRVILFGGYDIYADTVRGETWAYDFNSNTWSNMEPAISPPPRVYHTLTWDLPSNRAIVFGGVSYPYEPVLDDTWAYDLRRNEWTKLEPRTAPSARAWHCAVGTWRGSLLFGGSPEHTVFSDDDTWLHESFLNRWLQIGK